jgi:hypothetical protein
MASQLRWTSKSVDLLRCAVSGERGRGEGEGRWTGGRNSLRREEEDLERRGHYRALRKRGVYLSHGGMLGLPCASKARHMKLRLQLTAGVWSVASQKSYSGDLLVRQAEIWRSSRNEPHLKSWYLQSHRFPAAPPMWKQTTPVPGSSWSNSFRHPSDSLSGDLEWCLSTAVLFGPDISEAI